MKLLSDTVKSRSSKSQFKVKSQLKVQYLETKMKFHIKKTRFRIKSRFKKSKFADKGHSLNQDFIAFENKLIKYDPNPFKNAFKINPRKPLK